MVYDTLIIGGGASGLFCGCRLLRDRGVANRSGSIIILEKLDRMGKKLCQTGNGQGNISNESIDGSNYHSSSDDGNIVCDIPFNEKEEMYRFLTELGIVYESESNGRIYPVSRQANSVSDMLKMYYEERGGLTEYGCEVVEIKKETTKNGEIFIADTADGVEYRSKNVVLCAGGIAGAGFSSSEKTYDIPKNLGHSRVALYPSLVQLKTDTGVFRTLKGIKSDCNIGIVDKSGTTVKTSRGEVLFTDYGISGNAVFSVSGYAQEQIIEQGYANVIIDFLPEMGEVDAANFIRNRVNAFPTYQVSELFTSLLKKQLSRLFVSKLPQKPCVFSQITEEDIAILVGLVKRYKLTVRSSLGFQYAQVTKGGLRLDEFNNDLMSKFADNFYACGEILDCDGDCGGYNIHFAFCSAQRVAKAIMRKAD